jgi:preprotein translocase subunit SecA
MEESKNNSPSYVSLEASTESSQLIMVSNHHSAFNSLSTMRMKAKTSNLMLEEFTKFRDVAAPLRCPIITIDNATIIVEASDQEKSSCKVEKMNKDEVQGDLDTTLDGDFSQTCFPSVFEDADLLIQCKT